MKGATITDSQSPKKNENDRGTLVPPIRVIIFENIGVEFNSEAVTLVARVTEDWNKETLDKLAQN